MPDIPAAEGLGTVFFEVGLGDGPELLDPFLLVIEPVRVIDHMAHLVAQVAEDIGPVESFHQADLLGVKRGEIGAGQVEGNGYRDSLEGNAPLTGEIKAGGGAG
jgi:hypothetical protein